MADKNDKDDNKFADEPATKPPEDGRRQHKYSTADMKPENPWKRWCCTILTCLLCIAIIIVISIVMQKLFDPPEDEDWTDDVVNTTDDDLVGVPGELSGDALLMPKTMDYIEDVCAEERLGADDKSACQEACAPALDCCNPYSNGNSTCFETEPSGCFAYAKCHSLDGFIDPAHNDLDRFCSKASLESDRTECELACQTVSCCYNQTDSCVSSQFQSCLDYAACQNLKEDSIDVAPMDLDERCDKESPTCKRDCREALCCGDPNSACYRDNFLACLSYSSCTGKSDTKITVAPMYSHVEPAPDTLQDVCTENGLKAAPDKCPEACAAAQCCWEPGAGGCFGDDPLGCMEYQRCTILQLPQYSGITIPPAPAAALEPAPGANETVATATTLAPGSDIAGRNRMRRV